MTTPSPLGSTPQVLSGQALRNWLRTDGQGIFTAFKTGAQALDFMREHFGAIRTQDFYNIRREVLSVVESSKPIFGYPTDQLIPRAWHITDHGLQLSSEFQYRIDIIGHDPLTGELKEQWMTVAADRQLTQNEVQEVARSYIGEGGESGEIVLASFGEIQPLMRSR